jgi:hypothetical protein
LISFIDFNPAKQTLLLPTPLLPVVAPVPLLLQALAPAFLLLRTLPTLQLPY